VISGFDPQALGDIRVLVYDPLRANMLTTRAVLHGIGFRNIEGLTEFADLMVRLRDQETALCLIECSESVRELCDLVRQLRHGDLGGNPFMPLIGTLWHAHAAHVAELMNSGFDDVVVRPFSVAKVQERVRSLVQARKPFVVTSDYIGPDRGPQGKGKQPAETFQVPNILQMMVQREQANILAISEEVEKAKTAMQRQRLSKLARRIAMAAEVTIQAFAEGSSETTFVLDLLDSADRLVRAARQLDNEEVIDLADVLEGVAQRISLHGEDRAENAQLTRQLALALFVAYASENEETFHSELEGTLVAVRRRLDKARERKKRKQELSMMLRA
jgi:DNA-binding response OmpR family regulator